MFDIKIWISILILSMGIRLNAQWSVMGSNVQCNGIPYAIVSGWCDPKSNLFVSPMGYGSFPFAFGQLNINAFSPNAIMPQHPMFGRTGDALKYNYLNYYPYFDKKSGLKVWQPGGSYWNGYGNAWWYAPRDGAVVTRKSRSNWNSYSSSDNDIEDSPPSGGGTRSPSPKPSTPATPGIVVGPNVPQKPQKDICKEMENDPSYTKEALCSPSCKQYYPELCKSGDVIIGGPIDKPDWQEIRPGVCDRKKRNQFSIFQDPNLNNNNTIKTTEGQVSTSDCEDCKKEDEFHKILNDEGFYKSCNSSNDFIEQFLPDLEYNLKLPEDIEIYKFQMCLAKLQDTWPSTPPKKSGWDYAKCDCVDKPFRGGGTRPCISKKYVGNIARSVAKVTSCFPGLSMNEMFSIFAIESGGHLNAVNKRSSSTGLGQVVVDTAIKDLTRADLKKKLVNYMNGKDCGPVAKIINETNYANYKRQANKKISTTNDNERFCRLIMPPDNPMAITTMTAAFYMISKYHYFDNDFNRWNKWKSSKAKCAWCSKCDLGAVMNLREAIRTPIAFMSYNGGQNPTKTILCDYINHAKNKGIKLTADHFSMSKSSVNGLESFSAWSKKLADSIKSTKYKVNTTTSKLAPVFHKKAYKYKWMYQFLEYPKIAFKNSNDIEKSLSNSNILNKVKNKNINLGDSIKCGVQ